MNHDERSDSIQDVKAVRNAREPHIECHNAALNEAKAEVIEDLRDPGHLLGT